MQRLMALAFFLLAASIWPRLAAAQTSIDSRRPPIIDMHLHAYPLDDRTPPAVNPVTGLPSVAGTSVELRDSTLAALERYNIVKAVASGPPETVNEWRDIAPDRIMVGAWVDGTSPLPDLARLRAEMEAGRVDVLGELILQMRGMAPGDPRMEPDDALAEEMDIPVGIHTGLGPSGTPYEPCCPNFRVTLGNPTLVEAGAHSPPTLARLPDAWRVAIPSGNEGNPVCIPAGLRRSCYDQLDHPAGGLPGLPARVDSGGLRQAAALRVRPNGVA